MENGPESVPGGGIPGLSPFQGRAMLVEDRAMFGDDDSRRRETQQITFPAGRLTCRHLGMGFGGDASDTTESFVERTAPELVAE
jgi:hypothetical protein